MLNRCEERKMAMVMDAEFVGGNYFVPCNTVGPGSKNLASSLRYSLKRKAAAALAPCGVEGGSDWQLDPISDPSATSPHGSAGVWQERTWRALEPTVIGNRVQWTCNVAPTTPRSSDMMSSTLHCSDPSDDSLERRGSGLQDNMSDHSFTSTLTNDTDRENVSVLMPADLDFKFSAAAAEIQLQDVRSLLDVVVPGSLPPISDDGGYSDFELLSSQFPMISPNFEANEDSNSCGSGSGSSENHTWSSAAAENLHCCAVDEIIPGCMKFEPEEETLQQQDVEQLEIMGDHGPCGISPMLFAEQQQEDSKHCLGDEQRQQMLESDDANGMMTGAVSAEDEEALGNRYKEECGVELVQQLLACARAIEGSDVLAGKQHVARLRQLMSPKGSPMERVATYFTEALAAWLEDDDHADEDVQQLQQQRGIVRAMGSGKFGNAVDDGEYMEFSELEQTWIAYQVFYASCPYLIITHFTANQAILEAFEGEEKVHVVDLDIKQGLQWPSLIQALSLRAGGPPQLRITGVAGAAPDLPSMMATRNRLLDFADMFNVPLEFTILTENVESLQPWMLGIRDNEALAVNCVSSLHQLIGHPRRPLRNFLVMIHSLEPSVVTVVEQDSNHDQDFFPRFMDALHYFSSMFDSLAASVSSSLVEREMVERLLLGKEIMNIVGQHRGRSFNGRHQTADVWMRHMSEVGFQCCPLTPHSTLQAKFLLNMYPLSKYCLLVNEDGYLSLGWQDNPLYCVSCWC